MLANAQAVQRRTELDVERYTPLAKEQAASQQDLDNAVQNNLAATCDRRNGQSRKSRPMRRPSKQRRSISSSLVSLHRSMASPARRNCKWAPWSLQTAEWSRQFRQWIRSKCISPSVSLSILHGANAFPTEASRLEADKNLRLQLILADGSIYPHDGTFYFADRQVNESTGAIRLAGLFPNPNNVLKPGGYARVRAVIRTEERALLVPQRAVSELQGGYQVAVVDGDNKVTIRTGDSRTIRWIAAG